MDIAALAWLAGPGVVAGLIALALRGRAARQERWIPLAGLALGGLLGVVWRAIGWMPALGDEKTAVPYLAAAAVGISSAAAVQGLANAIRRARAVTEAAHGYIEAKLASVPADRADADARLKNIVDAMWAQGKTYPDPPKKIIASVMENDGRGSVGKTPNKVTRFDPSQKVMIFVEFNPLTRGQDIAHEQLHELTRTAANAAGGGLSNHWCCYSDTGG